MSCSENDGDPSILPKEQLESSSTNEGSRSESSTGGGKPAFRNVAWTTAEDALLTSYVLKHGEGNWHAVQRNTGLLRPGNSCRLRWFHQLKPHLKKGAFSPEEELKKKEMKE